MRARTAASCFAPNIARAEFYNVTAFHVMGMDEGSIVLSCVFRDRRPATASQIERTGSICLNTTPNFR